ncbi:hypothetical protein CDL15_Pgr008292 [Punica granatum]|uniref:Uncharacterized protein n=1 Tax=Punica granatum TaxID=22663 RepID=A0A218WPF4_PUNGR|nr:hypothetical protein CDL15_Pgr008292 [Punica granatum]
MSFQLRSVGSLEPFRVSIYSYSLFPFCAPAQVPAHQEPPSATSRGPPTSSIHHTQQPLFTLPSELTTSALLASLGLVKLSSIQLEAPESPLSSCDTPTSQKSSSSVNSTMAANIATVLLHMPVVEVTLPILLGV